MQDSNKHKNLLISRKIYEKEIRSDVYEVFFRFHFKINENLNEEQAAHSVWLVF